MQVNLAPVALAMSATNTSLDRSPEAAGLWRTLGFGLLLVNARRQDAVVMEVVEVLGLLGRHTDLLQPFDHAPAYTTNLSKLMLTIIKCSKSMESWNALMHIILRDTETGLQVAASLWRLSCDQQ